MGHDNILHGTVPAQMGMLDSTVLRYPGRQKGGKCKFCGVLLPLRTHPHFFFPFTGMPLLRPCEYLSAEFHSLSRHARAGPRRARKNRVVRLWNRGDQGAI